MSHANAALTPRARLRLAQLVVEDGWTYAAAAKMFMVAPRTAKKWADSIPRRRAGRDGRPQLAAAPQPDQDQPGRWCAGSCELRWRQRLGPVQIAGRLGMPASTVHAVLTRCRINRLVPHRPGHR